VRETLQATHPRMLIKILPSDTYWGTGLNGEGENMLGKLWMKIRDENVD
jgi:predicted NAD-dependent protein-ADP-ribosyltransferase YbiA (DUF1768 family)